MGGHGGLNILPPKRWNVYRYDNREKVRKDEEAAARADCARPLQRLRGTPASPTTAPLPSPPPDSSGHINLFHGLRGGFDGLVAAAPDETRLKREAAVLERLGKDLRLRGTPAAPTPALPPSPPPDSSGHINLFHGLRGGFDQTRLKREAAVLERLGKELGRERKKMKKEAPRTVGLEDEKYRMGYGVAGKGVKAPWYLTPSGRDSGEGSGAMPERKSSSGTKTMGCCGVVLAW